MSVVSTPSRIGVNLDGVLIHDGLPLPTIETQCKWIKAAGVFDYIEKNLAFGEESAQQFLPYEQAAIRHDLRYEVMGGIYRIGRDEQRWREGIALARDQGAQLFNCQVFAHDVAGHEVTAENVADYFCGMMEWGCARGCLPSFEVHVDMWSERFKTVDQVDALLAQRGIALRLTLDLAHLLFKLGDPIECQKSGIDATQATSLLHVTSPQAIFKKWWARGWVVHAHARAVSSPGRANRAQSSPNGQDGRGIQYPLVRPTAENDYHSPWQADAIAIWQQAMMWLTSAMRTNHQPNRISCEFLPFADYGGGGRYNIFANNVACAQWLRELLN